MKKYYFFLLIISTLIAFTNCKNEKSKKGLFIITKHYNFDEDTLYYKIPPPPPPPGLEWYSKLVFLFDSTDRVYFYQTTNKENFDANNKNENDYINIKYPPYLCLNPHHLVSFTSDNFIDFIKTNNDIFKLDTSENRKYNSFIFIASNKDTIRNKAFYELIDLIKPKSELKRHLRKVCFIVRKTTEEENKVIYYKRRNIKFNPEEIKWSTNFINGNCRPFTREYDSTEKGLYSTIKALGTISEDCTILLPIL
jgi:hypothetical protein